MAKKINKQTIVKALEIGAIVGSTVGIVCGGASLALYRIGVRTGAIQLPTAKVNELPTKKEWAKKAVDIIRDKVKPEVFVPEGTDTEAYGEALREATDKRWHAIGDVIAEFDAGEVYDGEMYIWVNKGPSDGYGIGFVNQDLANALYDWFESGAGLDRAIIKPSIV